MGLRFTANCGMENLLVHELRAQQRQQLPGFGLHDLGLGVGLVIVSEQMEDPVDHQPVEMGFKGHTLGVGLPAHRVGGDNDIAQQIRCDVREFAVAHGKGQDVRGAVHTSVIPVEFTHPGIVDDHQAQFIVRTAQGV